MRTGEKEKAAWKCPIPACSKDGRTGKKVGANLAGPHLLASEHRWHARHANAMRQQYLEA